MHRRTPRGHRGGPRSCACARARVPAAALLAAAWLSLAAWMAVLAAVPAAGRAESGSAAVAWGDNYNTQLGAGYKDTHEEAPVAVAGLGDITQLSAGSGHSLALLANGTVAAWGYNHSGQLGDGTQAGTWEKEVGYVQVTTDEPGSQGPSALSGVRQVAAADAHSLALLEGGTVATWGNDLYGQLGDGRGGFERGIPGAEPFGLRAQAVKGLSGVVAVAAGGGDDFALLSNHTLMAWGENDQGQLGIGEIGPPECLETEAGSQACSKLPRQVGTPVVGPHGRHELLPLANVVAVAAGRETSYALLSDHHVVAWGLNDHGQLGTGLGAGTGGPAVHDVVPEEVRSSATGRPLTGVVAIAAGESHALALLEDGEVVGWGNDEEGELGPAAGQLCRGHRCDIEATPIRGLKQVVAVAAGGEYSLALSGGRVYSFGGNELGELGDGSTARRRAPAPIAGLSGVAAIAAGGNHALALLRGGVAPPPPLARLEAGVETLRTAWTVPVQKVRSRPSEEEADEWTESSYLGEGPGSFEFKGLGPQSYEVALTWGEKKLTLIGTPRRGAR